MSWAAIAAAVVVVHVAYLVFQTLGALLGLRHRRWLWPHLAAVTWGVGIIAVEGRCPLTLLEKGLIARSGRTPYGGSFLDRYVFGVVLPDGTQAWVYGLHLLVIMLTYLLVVRCWLRKERGGLTGVADAPAE